MLTAVAATLLTIATTAPIAPPTDAKGVKTAPERAGTLAAVLPTPGAWALMGMGGLALVRARRVKR